MVNFNRYIAQVFPVHCRFLPFSKSKFLSVESSFLSLFKKAEIDFYVESDIKKGISFSKKDFHQKFRTFDVDDEGVILLMLVLDFGVIHQK